MKHTVIENNGFKYFVNPHGGQSAAIMTDNGRIYARDYNVTSVTFLDDIPHEPSVFELVQMLNQENK